MLPIRIEATAEGPVLITPAGWNWLNDDRGYPVLLPGGWHALPPVDTKPSKPSPLTILDWGD